MQRWVLLAWLCGGCDYAFRLDEVPPLAMDAPGAPFGPWTQLQPMTELNTGGADDTEPSMTDDMLEIYFTSNRNQLGYRLYRAVRASAAEPFGTPTLVDELAMPGLRGEISGDGLAFYYSAGSPPDIYSVTRSSRSSAFGSPSLEVRLSSPGIDRNPAVSSDGLHALVSRDITSSNAELMLFSREHASDPWSDPRELTEINTPYRDSAAAFGGTGGLVIVFDSDRSTMDSKSDLYAATRTSMTEPFTVEKIVELSTDEIDEGEPHLSADLTMLVFARGSDLYSASRARLSE